MYEKDLETKVCAYAKSLGWDNRKNDGTTNFADPDRSFYKQGVCFLIEFKRPPVVKYSASKLQAAQLLAAKKWVKNGFETFSINTFSDGKKWIDKMEKKYFGV